MASNVLVPLESNPDVMNKFLQKMGVSDKWAIVDVMGLEPEMLSWVPRPVLSVILLFPTSDAYEQFKQKEETEISSKGQKVSNNIFFMKQNISNACGTIALVHGVANNTDRIILADGHMKNFLDEAKVLDPAARGKLLENSEGIINAHKDLSQEGQTNAPHAEEPVNYHFVAFVLKDSALYELDGRKSFPINHGPSSEDTFLQDAAKVCKEYMSRDPNELRFTVVALTAAE